MYMYNIARKTKNFYKTALFISNATIHVRVYHPIMHVSKTGALPEKTLDGLHCISYYSGGCLLLIKVHRHKYPLSPTLVAISC